MAEHDREIEAIASAGEAADFDSVIVKLELAGKAIGDAKIVTSGAGAAVLTRAVSCALVEVQADPSSEAAARPANRRIGRARFFIVGRSLQN